MIDVRVELEPNQPWEQKIVCVVHPATIKKLVTEIKRQAGPQAAGISIVWSGDGLTGRLMRRGLIVGKVEIGRMRL